MRIISGKLGGRVLDVAERGPEFRPTSAKVREAIFSALTSMSAVESANVLDLYAGSGSLGIEALSRGAAHATFVESNPECVRLLEKNIRALGLVSSSNVRLSDALKYLAQKSSANKPFGLVLADPPYAAHPGLKIADLLIDSGLVDVNSTLVVEASSRDMLQPQEISASELRLSPKLLKDKTYGDTQVYYFGFERSSSKQD